MRGRLFRRLFVAASAVALIPACGTGSAGGGGGSSPVPAPGPFALTAPGDTSVGIATSPTLSWTASSDATSYVVQLALNATFTPVIMEERNVAGTTANPVLAHNTTYHWRVAATNVTGSVVASSGPRSFTTVAAAAATPAVPVLAVGVASRLPTFVWNAVPEAESYTLEIDDAGQNFGSVEVQMTGLKALFATSNELLPAGNYEARLFAVNGTGTSAPSAPVSFTASGASGTLDASLGGTGGIALAVGSGTDEASAVAVDAHGNIVLAGSTFNGSNLDLAVVRLRPDGFPDVFFGTNGRVSTDFNGLNDEALALVLQPDGKIVVAGYAGTATKTVMAVARYTTTGALDTTFSGDGRAELATGGTGNEFARGVGLAGTDIVVGGDDASVNMIFVQLDTNGTPDAAFDGDGVATIAVGTDARLTGLAVQGDGKIVGCGSRIVGDEDTAVVRLNANGTPDAGFGTAGVAIHALHGTLNDRAQAVDLLSGGEIVLAGYVGNATNNDLQFVVSRISGTNGSLIGSTTSSFGVLFTSLDSANAVAVDANDRIVTAGLATELGGDQDFAFIRYTSAGAEDTAFSADGKTLVEFSSTSEQALGVALDPVGRIVAVGFTSAFGTRDIAVARLWP